MEYLIEMRNITKTYPGVVANDDVSLKIKKGSVLCLVGENGAGKSTLMNILYGLQKPDKGQILIREELVEFDSSRDAINQKIGMVHQHFMLVNDLSVLDNIILGMEPKKNTRIDYKKATKDLETLKEKFGLDIPLSRLAGDLVVGLQQKVEIMKSLYRGADVLILDEPTAVLTPQEIVELFKNIKELTEEGKTVILITHKLNEVMEIADDIVVMRRGKIVANLKKEATNTKELAEYMMGREIPETNERLVVEDTNKILKLEGIDVVNNFGNYDLKNLSLNLNEGEILGVAGISGNGQNQLAQSIAGLIEVSKGKIILDNVDITRLNRKGKIKHGISYIPEDRTDMGLCLTWSISENAIGGYHDIEKYAKGRSGWLNNVNIVENAKKLIKQFDVRTPSHTTSIGSLSGGNQQKVLIARETTNDPKVIIASEPTRGVDIGAISFIHNYLIELRNNKKGVILISSDLDEVFKLSDRLLVLFEGEIVLEIDPRNISKEELGLYMSGSKKGGNNER